MTWHSPTQGHSQFGTLHPSSTCRGLDSIQVTMEISFSMHFGFLLTIIIILTICEKFAWYDPKISLVIPCTTPLLLETLLTILETTILQYLRLLF